MRLLRLLATSLLALRHARGVAAEDQTCSGVTGKFTLRLSGPCDYTALLDGYTSQVFDLVFSTTCASGSEISAQEDLDAKLREATGKLSGEEGAKAICEAMYDSAPQTPFSKAAGKGTDLRFEQMFFNGRTDWNEEVETMDEAGKPTSVLRDDTDALRRFYESDGRHSRVAWPGSLTNFEESTCSSNAVMCCYPKDRQANANGNNVNNGYCGDEPYDEDCVDEDPEDNTDLCFADFQKGDKSTRLNSAQGFAAFPGDDDRGRDDERGEGEIHCAGFAWANDEYDASFRYRANNLFDVSMYDSMRSRGYVKNIPGMPMCACMDQMPVVTQATCNQMDVSEEWEMDFDGVTFTGRLTDVTITFEACEGHGEYTLKGSDEHTPSTNDLWGHAAKLYNEGLMTAEQFGKIGRVVTNSMCHHAIGNARARKGFATAYKHDEEEWMLVAATGGLDTQKTRLGDLELYRAISHANTRGTPIIMRICADCIDTHRRIFYKWHGSGIPPALDLLRILPEGSFFWRHDTAGDWTQEFSFYSTYANATTGDDPWVCDQDQSYRNAIPFIKWCSPSGMTDQDQSNGRTKADLDRDYSYKIFPQGGHHDVAYYINKAEDYVYNAAGLTGADIGPLDLRGNSWETGGTFRVRGSGILHESEDRLHYLSQTWYGDVDVKVRIADFSNTGGGSGGVAGIMIRSDNSDDAAYAFVHIGGATGHLLGARARLSKGGSTTQLITEHDDRDGRALRALQGQDQRRDARVLEGTSEEFEGRCIDSEGRWYDYISFYGVGGDHKACLTHCPDDDSFVGYDFEPDRCFCRYSAGYVSESICPEGAIKCRVLSPSWFGGSGEGEIAGGHVYDDSGRVCYKAIPTNPPFNPRWLRIVKNKWTITVMDSADGDNWDDWSHLDSQNIDFPQDEYRIGFAVASGGTDHLAEAIFEDYEICGFASYRTSGSWPYMGRNGRPEPWCCMGWGELCNSRDMPCCDGFTCRMEHDPRLFYGNFGICRPN